MSASNSVLLIEDDDMLRNVTVLMLQYLGCRVETVSCGEEAVSLYKLRNGEGHRFDVVILDFFRAGGIGGEKTVKELLAYDPGVNIIASSDFARDSIIIDPGRYGFRAVLPKPYGIRQLVSALQKAFGAETPERRFQDRRKDLRHRTIALFKFAANSEPQESCNGIITDFSQQGFRFLTEKSFAEGQTILVTEHNLPGFTASEAQVLWMTKGDRYFEAGAQIGFGHSGSLAGTGARRKKNV
jgi:CheY-like chemotaxis protein